MTVSREKKYLRMARRRKSIRLKVSGSAARPRLCLHKSVKHLYAQLIDDDNRTTLALVTSNTKEFKSAHKNGNNMAAAKVVGKQMIEKMKEVNIQTVVFDRRGYKYHGVVKAFADTVREGEIVF